MVWLLLRYVCGHMINRAALEGRSVVRVGRRKSDRQLVLLTEGTAALCLERVVRRPHGLREMRMQESRAKGLYYCFKILETGGQLPDIV